MRDAFIKYNLADRNLFSDPEEAQRQGIFFPRDRELLEEIFTEIFIPLSDDYLPLYWGVSLRSFPPQRRKRSIQSILKRMTPERLESTLERILEFPSGEEKIKTLRRFNIFLRSSTIFLENALNEDIGSYLEKKEKTSTELGLKIQEWNKMRRDSRINSLDQSYGIPLILDEKSRNLFSNHNEAIEQLEMEIAEMIRNEFEEDAQKILTKRRILSESRRNAHREHLSLSF